MLEIILIFYFIAILECILIDIVLDIKDYILSNNKVKIIDVAKIISNNITNNFLDYLFWPVVFWEFSSNKLKQE